MNRGARRLPWITAFLLAWLPLWGALAEGTTGVLIAGGDRNFPPYEFIDERGAPDGFNIDLLKAIARRLDLTVTIELDTWQRVRDGLAGDRIQLATGMIRSAEREDQFDFSITHAGVFYGLFVRPDAAGRTLADLRGKRILVHAGAYSHDWLLKRRITDHVIPVPSPQEALERLASGRYDAAVIERLSGLELLDALGIDTVVMAGPPLMCAPYAFAVRKGNDDLLATLNLGIHLMHQEGVYRELYRKWFSVADSRARRTAMLRAGAIVLTAVIGVALAAFLGNLALRRIIRRKTAALEQSNRRFAELCDLLPQTVFETDADGALSFLNRSGMQMLGVKDKETLAGRRLADYLPPAAVDTRAWAAPENPRGTSCVVGHPDIDPFPALLYTSPIAAQQPGQGLRGILVDVSFQKELERQLIDSQRLEAQGRLAGGVAHDFNNIITGIAAYAELIRRQPDDGPAVAERVDRILTGCDRATDLVRHFLVTAGKRKPEKEAVRLGQAVTAVFRLLHPTYGRTVTFTNAIDTGADVVWAEPALIFQVLMNLSVNAAQAMGRDGGELTIASVNDAGDRGARYRTIAVKDTGPGIDPDLQGRIFEPFFTTRTNENGTGIGLFVVHQALADMGGSIRVESEPGRGTRFTLTLPADRRED